MNYLKKFLACILVLQMIASAAGIISVSAIDNNYKNSLIAEGFPEDYAAKLAELHEQHPNWIFEPLMITQMKGQYTWDYIVYMETDDEPSSNLVPSSDKYINWRHPSNERFDSGSYRASVDTVRYFLDPRNFMDEEQIFQFCDYKEYENITLSMVETVLKGTFMENAMLDGTYSNTTFAKYIYDLGRELKVNPIYLASRVRTEQGAAGTSAFSNGNVGDRLWYYYSNGLTGYENGKWINAPTSGWTEAELKAYNGYYNFFNIGSSGNGYFNIYKNGIDRAKKGTAEKKDDWGGDASWNTRWKSIYGGAYTATKSYINNYQNTSYLHKFCVDPRATGNFWHQYMQDVTGAYDMAKSSYKSFKDNGVLDIPYTFLIPVYDGMPDSCKHPDVIVNGTDARLINACVDSSSFANGALNARGWLGFNYPVKRLGYSIDGAETVWSCVSIIDFDNPEDEVAVKKVAGENAIRYEAKIDDTVLSVGNHTLMVMAELEDDIKSVIKGLNSGIVINVTEIAAAKITRSCIDLSEAEGGVLTAKGWVGSNFEITRLGYSIDGGETVWNGVSIKPFDFIVDETAVIRTAGRNAIRFEAEIEDEVLAAGEHTVMIMAQVNDGSNTVLKALIDGNGEEDPIIVETVSDHMPGDVNNDGKVNSKDVVALFRYIAKFDIEVNTAAIDINGDGKENNKDVVTLFRYLNDRSIVIY